MIDEVFNSPDNITHNGKMIGWMTKNAIPFFLLCNNKIVKCPVGITHNEYIDTHFKTIWKKREFINQVELQGRYWKEENAFSFWDISEDDWGKVRYVVSEMGDLSKDCYLYYQDKTYKITVDDRDFIWFNLLESDDSAASNLDEEKKFKLIDDLFKDEMQFVERESKMSWYNNSFYGLRKLNEFELLCATVFQFWTDHIRRGTEDRFNAEDFDSYLRKNYNNISLKFCLQYFHVNMRKKASFTKENDETTLIGDSNHNKFEEFLHEFGFDDSEYNITYYDSSNEPYSYNIHTINKDKLSKLIQHVKGEESDFVVDRISGRQVQGDMNFYTCRLRLKSNESKVVKKVMVNEAQARKLLIEKDTRLGWLQDFIANSKQTNDTKDIDDDVFNFRHEFGLMANSDMKYFKDFAPVVIGELGFCQSYYYENEFNFIKKVIAYCKTNPEFYKQNVQGKQLNYNQLKELMSHLVDTDYVEHEIYTNHNYQVVEIKDFETANYYGNYTGIREKKNLFQQSYSGKLCYTQDVNTWDSYTNGGEFRSFVLLAPNWENTPCKQTEGYPKDEYGMSMIFIFINDRHGRITNSNVRWNHGDGSYTQVDNQFTEREISNLIGKDFYKFFNVNKINIQDVYDRVSNTDEDLSQIFERVGTQESNYTKNPLMTPVKFGGMWNYVAFDQRTKTRKLLMDRFVDSVSNFYDDCGRISVKGKWNYVLRDGNIKFPKHWFNFTSDYYDGYAMFSEKQTEEENFIYIMDKEGNKINQEPLEYAYPLDKDGYFLVEFKNHLCNWIDTNNNIRFPNLKMCDCNPFSAGFSVVTFKEGKDKYYKNYINKNGEILAPKYKFRDCEDFKDYKSYPIVKIGEKENWIDKSGNILFPKLWFDKCYGYERGMGSGIVGHDFEYGEVRIYGRDLLIRKDGVFCDKKTKKPFNNFNPYSIAKNILGKEITEIMNQKKILISEEQYNKLLQEYRQEGFDWEFFKSLPDVASMRAYCDKYLQKALGNGMHRKCYGIDDGIVIKIADTNICRDNLNEMNDWQKYGKRYPILTQCFDVDQNGKWITMEEVLPLRNADVVQVLGIPMGIDEWSMPKWKQDEEEDSKSYTNYFNQEQLPLLQQQNFAKPFEDEYHMVSVKNHEEPNFLDFEDFCLYGEERYKGKNKDFYYRLIQTNQWANIFYKFCKEIVPQSSRFADLHLKNFGLAQRNGKPWIVILDYGSIQIK